MTKRVLLKGVSAWVFGLATTVFLIAMWGRAVVVDVDAMEAAAAPLADSATVVGMFTDWLDRELAESGVEPALAGAVRSELLERPSVASALEGFTGELVAAAAVPAPAPGVVDVSPMLRPLASDIEVVLTAAGVPVTGERLTELIDGLDPLVIREAGTEPYIGPASPTAGRLGTAAILALVTMAIAGWASVRLADDPRAEIRSLLSRVALGALSFAILLKAGSWVLDPAGGRAPLAESAGRVAAAKWFHPLVVSLVAALGAAATWWRRRSVRPAVETPSGDERPKPPEERQLIRSGRG